MDELDQQSRPSRQGRGSSKLTNPREVGTGGHNTADEVETVKNSMIKNLNVLDSS